MSEPDLLPPYWLHVIIDVSPDPAVPSADFWSAALGWPLGDPNPDHPEFASFVPPDGENYVDRQLGDHGPRIHVDLEVPDLDAAQERLLAFGAHPVRAAAGLRVLLSPGGMTFCLVEQQSRTRPGPVRWPGGHRTRPVQVCLDVPPAHLDDEVALWRRATGWRWVPGESPEFAGKLYPDQRLPVQLLFQRLATPEPATRAHLDLGTDDIESEVRRLVGLGAVRGVTGDGWVVLTDPIGMEFCVTGNAPD